ncbi:MAG TPA: site-2 protease family protein [Candidatus Eisenbacteria bacterium]
MRWSWQIAKVAGIPVRIHATFGLILLWVFFTDLSAGLGIARALLGVALVLSVFGCVVLHELGHALTARRYGVRTRDITLLPIGGVARLERIPERPSQEIAVALAGPAVNLVIAAAIFLPLALRYSAEPPASVLALQGTFLVQLLAINVFLAIFNLIPAFPMDGGRVLRALLATRFEYVRATQIAANVGQVIAFLFGLLGLIGNQPVLLFVALFVFIGAGQEAAAVRMRSVFSGVPVSRAMIRDFRTLRPEEPLTRAVELLLDGNQQDFPVLGERPGDPPLGILTRADLMTALAQGNTGRPVGEVTRRNCGSAHPGELLEGVFQRMQASGCPAVPVVGDDGAVVGMVTLENVGELAMVEAALGRSRFRVSGNGRT